MVILVLPTLEMSTGAMDTMMKISNPLKCAAHVVVEKLQMAEMTEMTVMTVMMKVKTNTATTVKTSTVMTATMVTITPEIWSALTSTMASRMTTPMVVPSTLRTLTGAETTTPTLSNQWKCAVDVLKAVQLVERWLIKSARRYSQSTAAVMARWESVSSKLSSLITSQLAIP